MSIDFFYMTENLYDEVNLTSLFFMLLESFTFLLYDQDNVLGPVKEMRLDLYCKKNKSIKILPSTQVMNM